MTVPWLRTVPWAQWCDEIEIAVRSVPDDLLRHAAEVLSRSQLVVVAGNGGSHALASHAAQALMKPSYEAGGGIAAVCLGDGVPTLTAHANDGGWSSAFAAAASTFFEHCHTTLLVFSSSGKSENIVRATQLAREKGCEVVAFTGFDGEPLKSLATVSIHVDSRDYEVVEPVHDALLHRVQHNLRGMRK
jgi:D-sedoheptulose 7-phosphate isomerase